MPSVTLTEYEIAHDRLPALCLTCGRPTTNRFPRTLRFFDEPGRWYGLFGIALLVSICFLPPLLLALLRAGRAVEIRLPYCEPDLVRFRRRERLALWALIP